MSSIPVVPESEFVGRKAKKLDGRKARRKRYKVTVLPPRMAKGRDPKRHFAVPMRGERQLIRGDKLMHHEDTIWLQAGVR